MRCESVSVCPRALPSPCSGRWLWQELGCELLLCLLEGKAGLWPLGKPAVLSAGPQSALRSTVSWLQRGHTAPSGSFQLLQALWVLALGWGDVRSYTNMATFFTPGCCSTGFLVVSAQELDPKLLVPSYIGLLVVLLVFLSLILRKALCT